MSRPRLRLLGRPGCHLCEEFRAALESAFPERFELEECCVDDRPEWRERFGTRIPVLLDEEGAAICTTRFDPQPLRERYGTS